MRYEPGVRNRSLQGHLSVGRAPTEEELALPGERKELVGEVNTTRDAVFELFQTYNGQHATEAGGIASDVNTMRASGTLQPTAQRDWIQGFLNSIQDLNRTNIEVPVKKLQEQLG